MPKRILVLNWRDIRHKNAGGAEAYVHQIFSRLMKQDVAVTLFTSNDGTLAQEEIIDGVRIVRRGGFWTVYFQAALFYVRHRREFDRVVESQNGIPFFTPLYVQKKKLFCIVHHIHAPFFKRYLPFPMSFIASIVETKLMPLLYRGVQFITVSQSSKNDLGGIGIPNAAIIFNGVDTDAFAPGQKSLKPTIVYIGRLVRYKSADVLLRAFEIVAREIGDAELIIAGDGDDRKRLEEITYSLGATAARISFLGHVEEYEKIKLLQSAWVFVQPSYHEGFGLTALEAAACGTAVVASNVPGLRDAVRDGESGLLADYGSPASFAEKIMAIIADPARHERYERGGRAMALAYSWDISAKLMYHMLV